MEKAVKKYSRMFAQFISRRELSDAAELRRAYPERLRALYASNDYAQYNVYPTMNVEKVYAIIAMCLVLKNHGMSETDIVDLIGGAYHRTLAVRTFCGLERLFDRFVDTYALAKKWNEDDHASRLEDGSISYDYFTITDVQISYRICSCKYVEMFEHYGIRACCQIFCQDDYLAYKGLSRHVRFVRHSDLATSDCCRDEVLNLKVARQVVTR